MADPLSIDIDPSKSGAIQIGFHFYLLLGVAGIWDDPCIDFLGVLVYQVKTSFLFNSPGFERVLQAVPGVLNLVPQIQQNQHLAAHEDDLYSEQFPIICGIVWV